MISKEDVIEFLVNEGYANNVVSAEVIHQHISDEFLLEIEEYMQLDEAVPLAIPFAAPAAGKILGAGLTAIGAYGTAKQLMKSKKAKPTEVVNPSPSDRDMFGREGRSRDELSRNRSPRTGRRLQNVTPKQDPPKTQPKLPTSSPTKPKPKTRSRDKIAPMGPRYRTIPDRPGSPLYQPGSTRKLIDITTGSHPSGVKGKVGKPPFPRNVTNVTPQAGNPKLPNTKNRLPGGK